MFAPLSNWYRSPSALALVASNLVPLWGVMAWGWSTFTLLVLFWLENVVIGLFNALRMLVLRPTELAVWGRKPLSVLAFCLTYGLFIVFHGVFVFHMFGRMDLEPLIFGAWTREDAARGAREAHLWLPLAALVASHLFSFLWNYLYRGEYRRAELGAQMEEPYLRVFILQVTIILGGLPVMMLGSPLPALLVLIGLKTWLDLKSHVGKLGGPIPQTQSA